MQAFVSFTEVDHSGSHRRETVVNVDAIIRIIPITEDLSFVVMRSVNGNVADPALNASGLQTSGFYAVGSLLNMQLRLNAAVLPP